MEHVTFRLSHLDAGTSSGSDYDTYANPDTGATTPDEEHETEWTFKVTPDMVRRLSLIQQPAAHQTAHNERGEVISAAANRSALEVLPTELQLEVFRHLDSIDACCLGLASPTTYPIFTALHGTKLPLNTRRRGPNLLESAWAAIGAKQCAQCGLYRCELHQHIRDAAPLRNLEYCAFKGSFGRAAEGVDASASASCFRVKPSKPRRCGRHPVRTTTVHQDDAGFQIALVA